MRKAFVLAIALCVVALGWGSPLAYAKPKKISKSVPVTGAPYPVTSTVNGVGCAEGTEGVHKTSIPFTPPGNGMLTADLVDFQGDWDLHLTDAQGNELMASTSGQPVDAQKEQIMTSLTKGMKVVLVACNWAGGPTATLNYTYTYR